MNLGSDQRGGLRRLVPGGIAAALVAALAVGAMLGWHRWTHPDLLADQSISLRLPARPVDDATVSVPLTWSGQGPSHLLTFRSARPVLSENTAAARITVQICVRRPGHVEVLGIYRLQRQCQSPTPLRPGATMTYPPHHPSAHQFLVVPVR